MKNPELNAERLRILFSSLSNADLDLLLAVFRWAHEKSDMPFEIEADAGGFTIHSKRKAHGRN